LSGLLGALMRSGVKLCGRLGPLGLWLMIGACGAISAFLNNTPIVVVAGPVVRKIAESLGESPRRFLIPLSYATILGGSCTLIGTSTNLLVNDMAKNAGEPGFSLFEIAPVGLTIALAGGIYLLLFAKPLLSRSVGASGGDDVEERSPEDIGDSVGDPVVFAEAHALQPAKAALSLGVFVIAVILAALGIVPIAASAFTGAVALILLRTITAEQAYQGLRPEILLLIAGMVVVGLSLEVTGLAGAVTNALAHSVSRLDPWWALTLLYGATLLLTEVLSNAAVAVLVTPIAAALAESLGVSPRPFIVAVMMAASAAFATPFGYQTNVLVFGLGRYRYVDFLRVGVPLNLLTWIVGAAIIPRVFPF
jgi:di/tricarboxylate transporter